MKIPKIRFEYAYPLDQNRRDLFLAREFGEYPTIEEVKKQTEVYREAWANYNQEDKIIKRMLELLQVTYSRDIEAYIFGAGINPMSSPLLIPIVRDKKKNNVERFIEVLVHELVHIFVSNFEDNPELEKFWKVVREEYKAESISVQNHLIVYAIVETVLTEIFGQEKMRELIESEEKDYQRAIELTDEIGPENILQKFKELIK